MFKSKDIRLSYWNSTHHRRCNKSRGGAACVPIDWVDEDEISEPVHNKPSYTDERRVSAEIIRRSR